MTGKGFGKLELFSVIALLSLVAMIAIPSIIKAHKKELQDQFYEGIIETFTYSFERIESDEELSKAAGEINCSDFEYNNKKIYKSCKINWAKANPIIDDLKITVESSDLDEKYENKTREEINNLTKNV